MKEKTQGNLFEKMADQETEVLLEILPGHEHRPGEFVREILRTIEGFYPGMIKEVLTNLEIEKEIQAEMEREVGIGIDDF